MKPIMDRREFLKISAVGGTLLASIYLGGCKQEEAGNPGLSSPAPFSTDTPIPDASVEPSVFVKMDGTGRITVTASRPEVGQGVRTAYAMLVAEELDAKWADIEVVQAVADQAVYGDQYTGGSHGIENSGIFFRRAGSILRDMLVTAAAQLWGVEKEACTTRDSVVYHPEGELQFPYAALVEDAAELPVPATWEANLKDPESFTLLGSSVLRYDAPDFINGAAVFCMDIKLPDMVYATVVHSPTGSGKIQNYDADAALSVAGVRDVLAFDDWLAVVAENTWAAFKGREQLTVVWDAGETLALSDAKLEGLLAGRLSAQADDDNILSAIYRMPYLAHMTLEPMNCTADVRADSCSVWAPTQNPNDAKQTARSVTRFEDDQIEVHVPLIGGGFGRRLKQDYVEQAVKVSQELGVPVQLVWTREEDVQHDYFHPFSINQLNANLTDLRLPRIEEREASFRDGGMNTGPWRSASNMTPAFVRESFIDEMAVALDKDPLELRYEIEGSDLHDVLETAAKHGNWGEPLPDRWGRGIAVHSTWGHTPTAQVVEVAVDEAGQVTVHRVVCAMDCGLIVNRDCVVAQVEGGILFGLSAALKGGITLENGRVQESNFHDHPVLRYDEMPEIEVYIVEGRDDFYGVGEMAVPPIAPALMNAIYDATGVRVRHLPMKPEDLV